MKVLKPNLKSVVGQFLRDARGATAVEYVVIATVVLVGILVGLGAIREALNTLFENAGNGLSTG